MFSTVLSCKTGAVLDPAALDSGGVTVNNGHLPSEDLQYLGIQDQLE